MWDKVPPQSMFLGCFQQLQQSFFLTWLELDTFKTNAIIDTLGDGLGELIQGEVNHLFKCAMERCTILNISFGRGTICLPFQSDTCDS